jgi:putative membrane protein
LARVLESDTPVSMSARHFLEPHAKEEVARAIRDLESKTCAEVVVAVRRISGHYRHTDYLVGFVLALAALCLFLFHPEPFAYDIFPLEMALTFAFGAVVTANLAPFRRVLTSRRLMEENVRRAARAAFVELGISNTKGRTGMLVFVSTFERRVEVVADAGLDLTALGPDFNVARDRLQQATAQGAHFDRFIEALGVLGEVLGAAMPRAEDDVNELADEVRA